METTTQRPTFGLPALTPKYAPTHTPFNPDVTLELSQDIKGDSTKTDLTKIEVETTRLSNADGVFLMCPIKRLEPRENSPLVQFASRGMESYDDRMKEYRANFPLILKTLYANGMLKGREDVLTEAFLNSGKNIRWCRKAFCTCGCSPAFKLPRGLWLECGNTVRVSLEERADSPIQVVIDPNRAEVVLNIVSELKEAK